MINQSREGAGPRPAAETSSRTAELRLGEFAPHLRTSVEHDAKAVIFTGIQGSGKSSFFREHFAATHAHINLDTLKTRQRERAALEACAQDGKPFVVDNTNASPEERRKYIELAKAHHLKVACYYFDIPLKAAFARNATRTGKAKVPAIGIIATHRRLKPPTFAEGFDQIFKVTLDPAGGFIVLPLDPSGKDAGAAR